MLKHRPKSAKEVVRRIIRAIDPKADPQWIEGAAKQAAPHIEELETDWKKQLDAAMDEAIESHREATAVKERLRTAQRRVHWLLLLFRTTERHEVAIEDVAVPEGRFMRPRLGSLTDKQGGWAVVVEDELTPPKVMALFRSLLALAVRG